MSAKNYKSATVVLGMHRSGTSALAGVLGLCGLALPKTLVPAGEANEKGFWESEPVKQVNDDLLNALGATWHSLELIAPERFAGRGLAGVRRAAREALQQEFRSGSDIRGSLRTKDAWPWSDCATSRARAT